MNPYEDSNDFVAIDTNIAEPFPDGPLDDNKLLLQRMAIQEKIAELDRRERALQQREEVVSDVKVKNFPFFKPVVHHDIKSIPAGIKQKLAYAGFYGWAALCLILVLNFVVAVITIVSPVDKDNGIQKTLDKVKFVFWAGLDIPIGIFGHFILCYWPLYKALSSLSIGRYTLFFAGYAVAIILGLIMTIGWYDYGASGLVISIMYFPTGDKGNTLVFVLNLLMAVVWGCFTALLLTIYIFNIKIARAENHTFAKAIEVTKSAMISTVGKAATAAVVNGTTERSTV
jgi:hypothetical protein